MQPLGWCSRGSYRSLWRLSPLPCTAWHCHWPQAPEGLSATPLGCISQATIPKTAPGLPVCAQSSPALCWAPRPSDLQGLPFLRRSSLSGSMSHHQEHFLLSITGLSFMGYHGKKPDSSNFFFFQGQSSLLLTLREAFSFQRLCGRNRLAKERSQEDSSCWGWGSAMVENWPDMPRALNLECGHIFPPFFLLI